MAQTTKIVNTVVWLNIVQEKTCTGDKTVNNHWRRKDEHENLF